MAKNLYFVMPLRNVGTGLAVLHGWHISALQPTADSGHPGLGEFRPQLPDLYVPAGDTGFWQGATSLPPGLRGAGRTSLGGLAVAS